MRQFRWVIALVLGAFVLAACGSLQTAVPVDLDATTVEITNPIHLDPHQSGSAEAECAAIGDFDYAYKIDGWDSGNMSGDYVYDGVTFTIVDHKPVAKTFDWSATTAISAVIVKGGPTANLWSYDPAVTSDTGLYAPGNADVSHVTFCWNEPPALVGEVTITKTAVPSFTRTHDWSIDKSVDPETFYLYIDGSGDGTATWYIDVTYEGFEDSDWNVTGEITVENTGDLVATITSMLDQLQTLDYSTAPPPIVVDYSPEITCPVTFPYDLPVGETLTCTYTQDLPSGLAGRNKAGVFGTFSDASKFNESTGIVPFAFDAPTTEVNAIVAIVDVSDLFGPVALGTLDAADYEEGDTIPFTYTKTFSWADYGADLCGDYTYENTASVIGDDEIVLDFATATLDVYVQCYLYETAYGKGDGAICFIPTFSNWGWTNPILPGTHEFELWAAAAQCDTSKGELVGSVAVVYGVDGYVTVDFDVDPPYLLEETHVYVDYGMFPLDRRGDPTISPGQYYNASPFDGSQVYVIAHAVVGMPDPDFGPLP
jgi:hypothetical protein